MQKKIYAIYLLLFLFSFISFAQYNSRSANENIKNTPVSHIPNDAVLFTDDMNGDNSVAALELRGWTVLNQDGGGVTAPFYQGTIAVFPAYEGPDTGYVASNYNGANGFLIDQWLISPEITVTAGDTLSFWHRSPDANPYDDSIYVRISTTAGIIPAAFDVNLGRYLVSETGWANWIGVFPTSGTVRFAVQYYITDGGPAGNHSNFIGLDLFEVVGVEASQSDLFISEYLEGTSNNKAIEIYNPTNASVDLSNYRVVRANNGSPTIQDTQLLIGTLAANQVYVIVNPSADPILLAVADIDTGTITFFNGDDYMALEKNIASVWTPIDVIGVLGVDPGTAWPVAGVTLGTAEHTLVRKDVIMMGSTNWATSAGTDSLNSEWLVYPQNTFIYLGNHTIIPVELTSFNAFVNGNSVDLNWMTATELNNSGFEIERKSSSTSWTKIGFVPGHGTTSEAKNYSYSDNNLGTGNYSYRLKQVDFDGTSEYSKVVEVEIETPNNFELSQNYPNPFNPTTSIKFNLPEAGNVKLTVYNLLGQEVKSLVNGFRTAGTYTINFDASKLSSGIYLYKIEMNNFTQVRKMTLLK